MSRAAVFLAPVLALPLVAGCGSGTEAVAVVSAPVHCTSTAKDAHDLGLRHTRLRVVEEGLEVTWTVSRTKQIGPEVGGFDVAFTDRYGAMYREASLSFWDEQFAALYGQDWLASVKALNVSGSEFIDEPPPQVVGRSVTMVFPVSVIEGSENVTHWRASLGAHVDGVDREDWCPDPPPGDDTPEPVKLPQASTP